MQCLWVDMLSEPNCQRSLYVDMPVLLKKMQAPPGLLGSISCILLVLSTCSSQHFVATPEPSTTEHPSIKKRKCLNKAGASGARGYPSQI